MLQSLSVQNFALIEQVSIQFQDGLHIITGETGSGKSILLGALNLILGERSDYSVIRDPQKKTVVEAVFKLSTDFKAWFEQEDIDWEEETVIRREIAAQGKSRAFINDTPVQLNQLKELTEQLVYIHSQHETLEIRKSSFQFDLVDSFADQLGLAQKVRSTFSQLNVLKNQLLDLQRSQQNYDQEVDFLRFQLNELDALELEHKNYDFIETELRKLTQVDELRLAYQSIVTLLNSEGSPIDGLRSGKIYIDKWKELDEDLAQIGIRLTEVITELQDLASDSERLLDRLESDPERIQQLSDAMDTFNRIASKHHANTQQELLACKQALEKRFNELNFSDSRLKALDKEICLLEEHLAQLSNQLYHERIQVLSSLENLLLEDLRDLKMEHAQLKIHVDKQDKLDANGGMTINLLFSANKGLELKPVEKAASGGELSRLMLAIQRTMSLKKALPTLILDEIDTGVSGEVALRMGKLLRKMGENIQVITITHLPQVAAQGSVHFEVVKTHEGEQTRTYIHTLSQDQRVDSLAKLIAGENVSESARSSALELLNN